MSASGWRCLQGAYLAHLTQLTIICMVIECGPPIILDRSFSMGHTSLDMDGYPASLRELNVVSRGAEEVVVCSFPAAC